MYDLWFSYKIFWGLDMSRITLIIEQKGLKSLVLLIKIRRMAKENCLRPFEYFVWLLETIPSTTNSKIYELLQAVPKSQITPVFLILLKIKT